MNWLEKIYTESSVYMLFRDMKMLTYGMREVLTDPDRRKIKDKEIRPVLFWIFTIIQMMSLVSVSVFTAFMLVIMLMISFIATLIKLIVCVSLTLFSAPITIIVYAANKSKTFRSLICK